MDPIEQARHDYPTLRALFLDDQWLQTCLEQQGDSTSGYQADLERAWALAEALAPTDDSALVDCFRYRMILSHLRERQSTIPYILLQRAVETGLWTQARADARAGLSAPDEAEEPEPPYPPARAEDLIENMLRLNEKIHPFHTLEDIEVFDPRRLAAMPQDEREQLIDFVLNYDYRSSAKFADIIAKQLLPKLARHLTPEDARRFEEAAEHPAQQPIAFELWYTLTQSDLVEGRPGWLATSLALILDSLHTDSRSATERVKRSIKTIEWLKRLLPALSEAQIEQAAAAALAVKDPLQRVELIDLLVPHLPRPSQARLLRAGLDAVGTLEDGAGSFRSRSLKMLARHIDTPEMALEALEIALTLASDPGYGDSNRSYVLAHLLPHLPPERQSEIFGPLLDMALKLDEWRGVMSRHWDGQDSALAHLAQFMNEAQLSQALEQIRDLPPTRRIHHEHPLAPMCLTILLPFLSGVQKQQALQDAAALTLDLPQISGAFEWIGSPLTEMAGALLPWLEGEARQQLATRALEVALRLPESHHIDQRPREETLNWLVPHLDAPLVQTAIDFFAVRRVGWNVQTWTMPAYLPLAATFAPHCSPDQVARAFRQTLHFTRLYASINRGDEFDTARDVMGFAPYLTGEALGEALDAALRLGGRGHGTYSLGQALEGLVPRLSVEQLRAALEYTKPLAQAEMAREQAVQQAERALEALPPEDRDETYRANPSAYTRFANHSPAGQTLALLVPYLPADLLAQAWEISALIPDPYRRAQSLAALAQRLQGESRQTALNRLLELVEAHHFSHVYNIDDPVFNPLEHAAHLMDGEILSRAVAAALKQRDVEALASLIPRLPDDQQAEISQRTLDITLSQDSVRREKRLSALGPLLSDAQVEYAFYAILSDPKETLHSYHLQGLAKIARTEAQAFRLLEVARMQRSPHEYWTLVIPLIPNLAETPLRYLTDYLLSAEYDDMLTIPPEPPPESPLGWLENLTDSAQAKKRSDGYRGLLLAALVPYLPADLIAPVTAAVLTLQEKRERFHALLALIERLPAAERSPLMRAVLEDLESISLDVVTERRAGLALGLAPDLLPLFLAKLAQIPAHNIRARLLAVVADAQPDSQELIQAFRLLLLEWLRSKSAYAVWGEYHSLRPPLLSAPIIAAMAAVFAEVAWDWRSATRLSRPDPATPPKA